MDDVTQLRRREKGTYEREVLLGREVESEFLARSEDD
jgi:hypothetical protein